MANVQAEIVAHQERLRLLERAPKPVELRVSQPAAFNGERKKARSFMNEVKSYLKTNAAIYDNNMKKIMFALSFMKEGSALAWRENFISGKEAAFDIHHAAEVAAGRAAPEENTAYGTIAEFFTSFNESFVSQDAEQEARYALENFVQGKKTLEDYISRFDTLVRQANLQDNAIVMDYFLRGLSKELAEKVLTSDPQPDTLVALKTLVRRLDKYMARARKILAGYKPFSHSSTSHTPAPKAPRPDPFAMDVDRLYLSQEEKDRYRRGGCCFRCGIIGHLSNNCPQPRNSPSNNSSNQSSNSSSSWRSQSRFNQNRSGSNSNGPRKFNSNSSSKSKLDFARIRASIVALPDGEQDFMSYVIEQLEQDHNQPEESNEETQIEEDQETSDQEDFQ